MSIIIGIILVAVVLYVAYKLIKPAGNQPDTTPEVPVVTEEPCGVFFMLRVFCHGKTIKDMETIVIPEGKQVKFEVKGFTKDNKPACIDGTKVNWFDSCGNKVFDSAIGSVNTITMTKGEGALIVTAEYLKHSFSWRITTDPNYVAPCN